MRIILDIKHRRKILVFISTITHNKLMESSNLTDTLAPSNPLRHERVQKAIPNHKEIIRKAFKRTGIEDESDPLKSVLIEPLEHVHSENGHNHNGETNMEEEFEYLSRTHDLEQNTEKTKYLEGIIDRLKGNTDIHTRVIVMRKGMSPNAFVFPEGSIFVSQSLLNKLDYNDEIAAVLAHELGHLIHETSEQANNPNKVARPEAIGRLHEMTADNKDAPKLLEEGGYNTLAFGTAIEKISGVHGGVVHQGGLARASQNVGLHLVRDYTTSNLPPTPKDDRLKGEARKTNIEIIDEEFDKYENRMEHKLPNIYDKLHPRDLLHTTREVFKHSSKDDGEPFDKSNRYDRKKLELVGGLEKYISDRLTAQNYTPSEITTFLFTLHNSFGNINSPFTKIAIPEELLPISASLREFDEKKLGDAIQKEIFGQQKKTDTLRDFLRIIESHMILDEAELKTGLIPINEPVLFEVLKNASETDKYHGGEIGRALHTYATLRFISKEKPFDADETRIFFQKAKNEGIQPSTFFNNPHEPEKKELKKIYDEVFFGKKEKPELLGHEAIDEFFNTEFGQYGFKDTHMTQILNFVGSLDANFHSNDVSAENRLITANYVAEKITNLQIETYYSVRDELNDIHPHNLSSEAAKESSELIKLQLQLVTGLQMFRQDSSEFYTYLHSIFSQNSEILSSLNPFELRKILNPLIDTQKINEEPTKNVRLYADQSITFNLPRIITITDFTKLSNLQPIQTLINSRDDSVLTLKEIKDSNAGTEHNIYGDSLGSLLYERSMRRSLEAALEKPLDEQDFPYLASIIENYYPNGPEKDVLLRVTDRKTLDSTDLTLDQKTRYAIENFERMGPEGLFIIADKIETLDEYSSFRGMIEKDFDRYLAGMAPGLNKAAGIDLGLSVGSFAFKKLFATAQQGGQPATDISTEMAKSWTHAYLTKHEFSRKKVGVNFDGNTGKFALTEGGRERFKTFKEYVQTLQGRSESERLFLAHKALVEESGAFANDSNRQDMANLLIDSLGVKNEFVESSLRNAVVHGDAKLMAFPGAKMLAPLLFRGLAPERVDFYKVTHDNFEWNPDTMGYTKLADLPTAGVVGLNKAIHGATSDVSEFGFMYQQHPDSDIYKLAQESEQQYRFAGNRLKQLLNIRQEGQIGENQESKIDPATESVIGAVEASGAVGVRALQLLTQLYPLPPDVRERLSSSFDKNPGLNKFWLWDNIWKMKENDPEISSIIGGARIKKVIGAGSLNTTIAATINDQGHEREVVIKMLNPNAAVLIGESHKLAQDTLEEVGKKGKFKKEVNAGLLVVDLAQKWCIEDINDKTFLKDDAVFRHTISGVNQSLGRETFFAPETVYNGYRLKVEDLAEGRTLNQVLNDSSVSNEQKTTFVDSVLNLYAFQMEHATSDGETFLLQSDPHVGNFVVDEESQRLGVIDRNMYLSAKQADIDVVKMLIDNTDYEAFTKGFLQRVFKHNHSGLIERTKIMASMLSVKKEYERQVKEGNVDRFGLLRSVMEKVTSKNLEIPLHLQLMMRNVEAMKRLAQDHGLSLPDYFNKAA